MYEARCRRCFEPGVPLQEEMDFVKARRQDAAESGRPRLRTSPVRTSSTASTRCCAGRLPAAGRRPADRVAGPTPRGR